ncbi:chemotaxis protein CheB [Cytophagaceae bacterium ABcell3]|nr:chemotaxis protein CheB [Cytophagaceae bacterium ABcell3]
MDTQVDPNNQLNYVVGIGASAGGLEAINEMFDNVPPDAGCAFILVQHLSPDYKSLIAELLAKHTEMKVIEAEDNMLVRPNCVYVIPVKKYLTIRFGRLKVSEKEVAKAPNVAIDKFFESLAFDQKDKAISIILSGTGSDGTKGAKVVKENGGNVIVQDPLSAKFDGMPNSAISAGVADVVVAPEFIAEEIIKLTSNKPKRKSYVEKVSDQQRDVLGKILDIVGRETSFDFNLYKKPTIVRRLLKRIAQLEISSPEKYLRYLKENPEEVHLLYQEFLITVTRFFRDNEAFHILGTTVLPEILDKKDGGDIVKIWVAGCSTGQEAYSIAILIMEYMEMKDKNFDVKIFATDLDKDAIDVASKGVYPHSIEGEVSSIRLGRYFSKVGGGYQINQSIRRMVIFAQHNIIKDAPFSKTDLISCRNLLIYFQPELQKKVLATFHFSLNPDGVLFLGPSENPGVAKEYLSTLHSKWKIYKKNKHAGALSDRGQVSSASVYNSFASKEHFEKVQSRKGEDINELFCSSVSEDFHYAGVFVNDSLDVKQAVGDFKKYLSLPEKKLTMNLQKMVHPDLVVTLSSLVRQVLKRREKVVKKGVKIRDGENIRVISLVVRPVEDKPKTAFILFGKEYDFSVAERADSAEVDDNEMRVHYEELEGELKETKANLQSTVEELETSNEELQSTIEELLSANEELQSTNEELQSLNEELHTVNSEHQQKIKELIELNDDLDNYFRSTDIGQVFVDEAMRVKKFTPAATKLVNLIEADIGRPLNHISNNIQYQELQEDVEQVVKHHTIVEKEIGLKEGKFFQMRVVPYITQAGGYNGAVMTFVDITRVKSLNNLFGGVLSSSVNGIMAFTEERNADGELIDYRFVLSNRAANSMIGFEEEDIAGHKMLEVIPVFKSQGLFDKLRKVSETGIPLRLEHFMMINNHKIWLLTSAVRIEGGIALSMSDITEKKKSEENTSLAIKNLKNTEEKLRKLNEELEVRIEERTKELRDNEERFRLAVKATNDVIWDWDILSNQVWWSEGLNDYFGIDNAEDSSIGIETFYDNIHEDDREKVIKGINKSLNTGDSVWGDDFKFKKADGSIAYLFSRGYVLKNEYEMPYRMVGSMIDLSDLKQTQEELNETNENLVKINNDLDNFIYTASHDLKAPISNIEGLVYSLEGELAENKNEHILEMLDLIKTSIERFKNTIKDLTEISKVQKNLENEYDFINVEDVLKEIKMVIPEIIEENNAKINLLCQPSCKSIKFSKKNFQSILYNFITNGIKYRKPKVAPVIDIDIWEEGDFNVLMIRDNGLGIEPEKKAKVFDMFKRLHDHVEGTGLGLYIVKRIMDNSGGKIEVDSELGEGSTFKLYFPK